MEKGIKITKIELVERAGQYTNLKPEQHTDGFKALLQSRATMETRISPYEFGTEPEKYFTREVK